jgi:hypothetical protein
MSCTLCLISTVEGGDYSSRKPQHEGAHASFLKLGYIQAGWSDPRGLTQLGNTVLVVTADHLTADKEREKTQS